MNLTEAQLADIRVCLFKNVAYRETYAEIYDHVLNALESEEDVFDISLVHHIIRNDFGSFDQIKQNEAIYLKQMRRHYFSLLGREMLAAFRLPELRNSLLLFFLCLLLFSAGLRIPVNGDAMIKGIGLILIVPGVYYLLRRYVADRNQLKPSLKYDFMHIVWMSGMVVSALLVLSLAKLTSYAVSASLHISLVSSCYFLSAVYVRAFIRLYHKKLRVLTA